MANIEFGNAYFETDDIPSKKFKCDPLQNLEVIIEEPLGYIVQCDEVIVRPWLSSDSLPMIIWLKERKLLKKQINCTICTKSMNWTKSKKTTDGFVWKCQNKYCEKYKAAVSIRRGSIFEKSHLSLQKWIHSLYLWSDMESEVVACKETNISVPTMIGVYRFFREVCKLHLQHNPIHLGGPEKVVQVIQLSFLNKPNQKSGKISLWILCIVDTSTHPLRGYMDVIDSQDAKILLPIIQKVVKPGSIIHIKEGHTYQNLLEDSPSSIKFAEIESGMHNEITNFYWDKHKSNLKKIKGFQREFLYSYLQEFMWRDYFSTNAFDSICNHIAIEFPL